MRHTTNRWFVRIALALSIGLGTWKVGSAQFTFNNFSGRQNELILQGHASVVGSLLRLNPRSTYLWGAAYYRTPQQVIDGFETVFTFRIWDLYNSGADGFAFLIVRQIQPPAYYCCLGYTGMTHSIAFEFDTYYNSHVGDPDGNHASINTRWEQANDDRHQFSIAGPVSIPFPIDSGREVRVRIAYVNEILSLYLDDSSSPLMQIALPRSEIARVADSQGRAYVGFIGGTGGSAENHDILSWTFQPLCTTHNGDIDANNCIDDADLLAVLFAFGNSGQNLGRVDVNCDRTVDDADLLIVLFNFGSGC